MGIGKIQDIRTGEEVPFDQWQKNGGLMPTEIEKQNPNYGRVRVAYLPPHSVRAETNVSNNVSYEYPNVVKTFLRSLGANGYDNKEYNPIVVPGLGEIWDRSDPETRLAVVVKNGTDPSKYKTVTSTEDLTKLLDNNRNNVGLRVIAQEDTSHAIFKDYFPKCDTAGFYTEISANQLYKFPTTVNGSQQGK